MLHKHKKKLFISNLGEKNKKYLYKNVTDINFLSKNTKNSF